MVAVLLAAGCAHGTSPKANSSPAASDKTVASDDIEHDEPRAVRDEQKGEHVEVPGHGRKHDRMASTGKGLPDSDAPTPASTYNTSPDNTRVNERDRESSVLTPLDQSEEESDRDLTQSIRKSVIADDSLSFTAKNIKIITRGGFVTLRGPVNNAHEKTTIERAARDLAGAKNVVSELEVNK